MFIVLEGLDGAGKSTQVSLLREYFAKRGIATEYLHFPRFDAPIFGDMIARFLRGEFGSVESVNPYLVALLYAEDRADAARQIRSWLEQGRCVIVDRYVYSNIGYQCAKVATEQERKQLCDWILNLEYNYYNIPRADLNLFLDVPFEFTRRKLTEERSGDDRDYLAGSKDIHEQSLSLQEAVRRVYIEQGAKGDLQVIDCSDSEGNMASAECIFSRIVDCIER